jgi:hypothetical protein
VKLPESSAALAFCCGRRTETRIIAMAHAHAATTDVIFVSVAFMIHLLGLSGIAFNIH